MDSKIYFEPISSSFALAMSAVTISAGVWYWLTKKTKSIAYEYDQYLHNQSYLIENSVDIHRSHPDPGTFPDYCDVSTVSDIFEHGLKIAEHRPCLGHRRCTEEPYRWMSFAEVSEKVLAISQALCSMCESNETIIGISSKNTPEYLITQLACACQGHPVVPLYDTFGEPALRHILLETQPEVVLCETVNRAREVLRMAGTSLRHVIVSSAEDGELSEFGDPGEVRVHGFEDLLRKFHKTDALPRRPVNPEALFMICYTSGCSGQPKGVMIKHAQFVWTLKCLTERLEDRSFSVFPRHMCYLPLAHILEQLASFATLLFGGSIGFLTTDYTGLLDDLRMVRPTYFFTVPRVLSRIYSRMRARLDPIPLASRAFTYAIDQKNISLQKGVVEDSGLMDYIFFRKARALLGGCVKAIVCGGAPTSEQVLRFSRAAFNCPVLQAYGLTETCGVVSIAYFGDSSNDHVGALLPGLTARLADVPSMNIHAAECGVGELLVQGRNCTGGYFMDSSMIDQLIDADGWLHTGDIARWGSRGELQIVGRCKASFKLSQGEYVSPERVESIYQLCNLVEHIFVDGRPVNDYPVAVVVPYRDVLRRALTNSGSKNVPDDLSELCANSAANHLVLSLLHRTGELHGLKGFEQVKAIHLSAEPFTIENKMLTANLKLSRAVLKDYFAGIIDNLYSGRC